MSDFDPSSFLETVFTEPSITERLLCPPGEFPAIVDKVEARAWTGKADSSKSGVVMDIHWSIEDQSVKEACKRDKVTVRQSIMFNTNENGIGIDMEKAKSDVAFGRLRDALGLNAGTFSPSMLNGRMAKVRVTHSTGTDKNGLPVVNENITAVTKY
jgi:hypothetical protein